jgi:hypothetical protein
MLHVLHSVVKYGDYFDWFELQIKFVNSADGQQNFSKI